MIIEMKTNWKALILRRIRARNFNASMMGAVLNSRRYSPAEKAIFRNAWSVAFGDFRTFPILEKTKAGLNRDWFAYRVESNRKWMV